MTRTVAQPTRDDADAVNGIRPTLRELIALRALVARYRPGKRGRLGVHGPALSPMRGRGMEYAESREYMHGDDARHMDWRITARTGKAHTKVFHAERERLTLVVADTNPRLYFGTRVCFKSVQAARLGAVAVWQAIKDGDRVATLRGSRRDEPVRPAAGMRGALPVLNALNRWYSEPPADDGGLVMAIRHANRIAKPGTRVIVLADPSSVLTVDVAQWSALSQHKDVLVVLVTDPLETEPPMQSVNLLAAGQRRNLSLDAINTRVSWDAVFGQPLRDAGQTLKVRGIRAVVMPTTGVPSTLIDWMQGAAQAEVA